MSEPRLIKCDNCSKAFHTNFYLGSLTAQGNFIYQKKSSSTCIITQNFTLIHDCGFTIKVEEGIIQTELSPLIVNG